MEERAILEIIKNAIMLEIANEYDLKEDEIIVYLLDGTIAKIEAKKIA